MLKTTTEFNESILMLFSSHPEAWRRFESGLRDLAAVYAKAAVAHTKDSLAQNQFLGKFDNCNDLAAIRQRLEDAE